MSSRNKQFRKRKAKKPRNEVAYAMILTRRGGAMKHRCEPRGGSRNVQKEYMSQNVD